MSLLIKPKKRLRRVFAHPNFPYLYDDEPDEGLIQAHADGRYVVDALTPIGEFNKRFGAEFDDSEYDTLGGMLAAAIGHLPETGEEINIGRFDFRIARADARRVHALHMTVRGDA